MKWLTHQSAAVAAALALQLPAAGIAAACVGAVLPDVLDQRLAGLARSKRARQRAFNRIHRGATHWFGWWLALFLAGMMLPLSPLERAALMGLGFGGVSHVILDMLTPQGVPLHPFSRKGRFSLKLCATGSLGEYCFLAAIAVAAWFFLGEDVLRLMRHAGQGRFFL